MLFPFGVNSRRESVTSMTGITAPDRFASSNALSLPLQIMIHRRLATSPLSGRKTVFY
ncbi:MAG: hypothetical protein ACLTTW_05320 [Coprobacter sp.]